MGSFGTFSTEVFNQYGRDTEFKFFYNTNSALVSPEIQMDKRWKLKEIRVHASSSFTSVEYFRVHFSSPVHSYHNKKLLSYSMSGLQTLWVNYVDPLLFDSDEHMIISFSNSGGVYMGIEVLGWAILG